MTMLDKTYIDLKSFAYKNPAIRGVYDKLKYGDRKKLVIYPTFRCNYRCPYCNVITRGKMHERYKEEHTGFEWAVHLNEMPPSILGLSGGELFWPAPGSRWDLRQFLENIDPKHYVAITSNLSQDPENWLPWFLEVKKHKQINITFSFHPTQTGLEDYIARYKLVQAAGIHSTVSIVAERRVLPKLKEYKEAFNEIGARLVIHNFIDPLFSYSEEEKKQLLSLHDNIRDKPDPYLSFEFDHHPSAKTCVSGKDYFLLDPEGQGWVCQSSFFCATAASHEKWRVNKKDWYLGNIFEGTLKLRTEDIHNCLLPCAEYCDRNYGKVKPEKANPDIVSKLKAIGQEG